MTPDAKRKLSSTIRALRTRLLADLADAMQQTYRLALPDPALPDEAARVRRRRLLDWLAEHERARADEGGDVRQRLLDEVIHEAASTWLNRLVILRLVEGFGLRTERLLTGGWGSPGYLALRELAPALTQDEGEGFDLLLRLAIDELSVELPGLFGDVGLVSLVPLPIPTLKAIVQAFDDPELQSCWTDDMTLGWVYQYWNDPQREELDAKIAEGGKIERHEIASKTQMFTERYMVDWLLQNSLGTTWLAICRHHGWTADLPDLEARRATWRERRARGDVAPTAPMPLHDDHERRWVYWLPQELPATPATSVRDLRLLDPACGSGHFLVVAFDMLLALYAEEARHRGEAHLPRWSRRAVVEHILEHNLHGVDIDPRAVQIAAAALWLKARVAAPEARPARLHLVAPALDLDGLRDDDPSLLSLLDAVHADTALPHVLMQQVVRALAGADHLGTLLRVDRAVSEALAQHARLSQTLALQPGRLFVRREGTLVPASAEEQFDRRTLDADEAQELVLAALERFLSLHTHHEDLGLRLKGQQLAAGVRFMRLVQEGRYDLVVGNPPYQGTSKMADTSYIAATYPRGKADLYAAFLERSLQLTRDGGISALLTMRSWMFIAQYAELRRWILETQDLRALGDFAVGAFDEVPNDVLSVVVSVLRKAPPSGQESVAQLPTPLEDRSYDRERTARKRAAVGCGEGRVGFRAEDLRVVPEWPIVYWWGSKRLNIYSSHPKIGDVCPAKATQGLYDNTRFIRYCFEIGHHSMSTKPSTRHRWVPFTNGADGETWFEPLKKCIPWGNFGIEAKNLMSHRIKSDVYQYANENYFFRDRGIAFSMIGGDFGARMSRFAGVFGDKGRSLFPESPSQTLCLLNSIRIRKTMEDLNPSISFQAGDVNRLPLFPIANADEIFSTLEAAFTLHESHREPSVEFRQPGPSPWEHAQAWAQVAVDRPDGAPLPPYEARWTPEPPTDHVSYALGVALGRFDADGGGVLTPGAAGLPDGILLLDATTEEDDLGAPACAPLRAAWEEHGAAIDPKRGLKGWLRERMFELHRKMYENRPIHWPLSSAKRTFVAWVNIHRMTEDTLRRVEVRLRQGALPRLEGALADLRSERATQPKDSKVEGRLQATREQLEELQAFLAELHACAERGPPPTGQRCPAREVDARYAPDLDDGVMINSAALWPLLSPQWKDPRLWWAELAAPGSKADYDWSHLAQRYWPTRVEAKCRKDPSLGVAHGCFWRLHPERAWAWELRLQDEIEPGFRIREPSRGPDDPGDVGHRAAWLRDHPEAAIDGARRELVRRHRKSGADSLRLLEPGLWTARPATLMALELELSDDWDAGVLIDAPDAEAAYSAWEAARPAEALAVMKAELIRRWSVRKKKDRHQVVGLWYDRSRIWQVDPEGARAVEAEVSAIFGHRVRLMGGEAPQLGLFG